MHLSRPLLLLSLFILLAGCKQSPDPSRMTRGDQLYDYYCRECHTYRGLGDELQNLPVGVSQLEVNDLILMIKHGYRFGHPMGHFPQMSDQQAETVARYAVELRRQKRLEAMQRQATPMRQ